MEKAEGHVWSKCQVLWHLAGQEGWMRSLCTMSATGSDLTVPPVWAMSAVHPAAFMCQEFCGATGIQDSIFFLFFFPFSGIFLP